MSGREITDEEVQRLVDLYDSDGNGVIDFDEFKRIMMQTEAATQDQRDMEDIEEAFCAFIRTKNIKELAMSKSDPVKYKALRH